MLSLVGALLAPLTHAQEKPAITLDEFFDYVNVTSVSLAPDGSSVAIGTSRPDWKHEKFRRDLWIVRGKTPPVLLTTSGEDSETEWSSEEHWIAWSPDSRWIAFLAERQRGRSGQSGSEQPQSTTRIYLVPSSGGESIQVSPEDQSVHAFAWGPDSQSIYFAASEPWSRTQQDAYQKDWKDVVQYRESERGDAIFRLGIRQSPTGTDEAGKENKNSLALDSSRLADKTTGTSTLAHLSFSVSEIVTSHDGKTLAIASSPANHRFENVKDYEIYLLDTSNAELRQVTHNTALESELRWSYDDRFVFFKSGAGRVEGEYEDIQSRVYALDRKTGKAQRWAAQFDGSVNAYDLSHAGGLVVTGQLGAQTQVYQQHSSDDGFEKVAGWQGSYSYVSLAERSSAVAFVYSTFGKPAEVYLADSIDKLDKARSLTKFNEIFTMRQLPEGRTYHWKADDGRTIEGVLLYPPGKMDAKHLPMLTLIHGGPAFADLNTFTVDWPEFDWAVLAATRGWLVFRPNYRGSTGYGDSFQREISQGLVSRPGKDILEGVAALIKDGIADPDRLTVGGYSYGGFMTNWLITQTTEFKAAVTGAGAVEYAANWGNNDVPFDDAWFLGGTPWEKQNIFNAEAAIFQMNKVKTPTHIVGGANDVRVYIAEQYLLERALQTLSIPHKLLIFPGEGHDIDKNPWHGKIKVREELNWLEKYCPPN
ncbi:MAG TPA: S9 family peptidase [Candidatus Sulfotelmatobacter sp.]|nr:S9 family peptidase [Candidatus Sulfotelmatobacter sp.]